MKQEKAPRVSVNRDDLKLSEFDAGSTFFNRSKRVLPEVRVPTAPVQKIIPIELKLQTSEESAEPKPQDLFKKFGDTGMYFAPISRKEIKRDTTTTKPAIRNGKQVLNPSQKYKTKKTVPKIEVKIVKDADT